MIPIYLKMEGFLTFKNTTLIDFDDFADSGIFLVSGPTGSGKTSIFDGISYALYGKATGGGREAKELRSHLIGDDDEFSVEFKFRSGNDEYLINRWQKGQRAGKVRLVINDDDENPITKVREINDKIFEVLGLNADQFCKIVMLPQGEFRNFLSSSSKEKSEILRKLFDTDHYAQIREMIRKRLGQILGQVKEAKTLIDSEKTISDAARQAEDPEEILSILKTEWQEKEKESQDLKVQLELLRTKTNNLFLQINEGKQINADLEEKASLAEQIKQAEKEEERYKEDLKRSLQLNSIRPVKVSRDLLIKQKVNHEALTNQGAELAITLKTSQDRLEQASIEQELNPKRQLRVTEITSEIEKINKNLEDLELLKISQEKFSQAEVRVQELKTKVEQHKHWIEQRDEMAKQFEALSKEELLKTQAVTDLRDRYQALKDTQKQATAWQKLQQEQVESEKQLKKCQDHMKDLEKESGEAQKHYESLRAEFQKQGLAQYAHGLAKGEACPLCGSLDHPAPFAENPDLDQTVVNQAELSYRKLTETLVKEKNNEDHFKKEIQNILNEIKQLEEEVALKDLEADIVELQAELKKLEEAGLEQRKELDGLKTKKTELEEQRNKAAANINKLAGAAQAYDQAKEELTGFKVRLEDLKKATQDMNGKELLADLKQLQEEQTELNKTIQRVQVSFQQADQLVTRHSSTLKSLTNQIKDLSTEIQRQEASFYKELKDLDLSFEEYLDLENDLKFEKQLKAEAELFFKQLEANRARYEMMKAKLRDKTAINLAKLEEEVKELKSHENQVAKESEDCIRKETGLKNAVTKTTAALSKYNEWEDKRVVASRLDLTTGKGTTFENYVLGYYLDGVLINANQRLRKMTSDRFHLIREVEDSGDRRAIEGLNLNVFDTYSNTQRDVKTLSGGEGFKASLALALGLSDFIQENKAGIRLDTIFIDEGFGTLDQESLDSAMETILELQGLGRLVGIISHVEELKERIPTQIVVENKREEGSVVKIIKH